MRWREWLVLLGVMALASTVVVATPSTAMAVGTPDVTNATDLLEMADEIGLSRDQRSTLRALKDREERELGPMRERARTLALEMQRLMQSEQPDRAALAERMREAERLGRQLEREEAKFRNLIRNTVSSSQIRAAEEYMQEHLDEHEDIEEATD